MLSEILLSDSCHTKLFKWDYISSGFMEGTVSDNTVLAGEEERLRLKILALNQRAGIYATDNIQSGENAIRRALVGPKNWSEGWAHNLNGWFSFLRKYGYCDYAGNYFQTLKKLAGT